ncbi:MAG: alcohol dehydrogenase catalytic domain-containing protein [Solirubrobacteraceae bacterium]|nr:alcohol dehydrogenase catalytic domain-containing protein [Solirubrobacteraceae bacterium]
MKAAVVESPGAPIAIAEVGERTPGRGEVAIDVAACGICHTDGDIAAGQYAGTRFPLVPGHEIAGTISAVGPGVDWPTVGTRVGLPWLYSSCGRCRACLHGDGILCRSSKITGLTEPGGYQERMLADPRFLVELPDELDPIEAAPLMCAGFTAFTGLRRGGMRPGDRVAVTGFGGLGEMGVAYARAMGGRVAVVSGSPDKERSARAAGAELFVDARDDVTAALLAWDGGADLILHTAPAPQLAADALRGLDDDGVLVVLGVGEGSLSFTPHDVIERRRRVIGVPSGSPKELRDALRFAAQQGIRPSVTPFALDDVAEAVQRAHALPGRAVLTMSAASR